MKKMISMLLFLSFVFMGCASSPRHSHDTCPHKKKHHTEDMESKNVGSEAPESAPEPVADDASAPKASGFGTDSGEPTQK